METLFAASVALDEDLLSDQEEDPTLEDMVVDDIAEVLFLTGVEAMEDVIKMAGDGSQGPYGQISKSKGWFIAALQSPNRDFRCTFR
jgi:hypothetical protein